VRIFNSLNSCLQDVLELIPNIYVCMYVSTYVYMYVYYTQNKVIYIYYYKMIQNLTENYLQCTIVLGVKPSL